MSGILFLMDVVAVVMIVLWSWALERPGGGWRVRLFDMRLEDPAETDAPARAAPRWRSARREAAPWRAGGERRAAWGRSVAMDRRATPTWRRSL